MALFENNSIYYDIDAEEEVIRLDPTFGTNNYGEVKILSATETYVRNLIMLLIGRPGFYPSIPTLGMDISKYLYNFTDEIDVNEIKSELVDQCEDYLPDVESGDFDVFLQIYKGRPMLIFKLPVIIDEKTLSAALGISVNEKGEFVYHFVENKTQLV